MNKKLYTAAVVAVMSVLAVGCGKKADPQYLSGIKADEYISSLADYSSIPVEVADPVVEDSSVDMNIQYALSMSTELVEVKDRDEVQTGDVVNIDYEGKKDGVAFDGGTATGYDLTIGSGSFIDGFEDGLVGKKVGETLDLDLTFPENYSNEELAGQDVVFTVTINKIQERKTPELTDDWVATQNIGGVETVDQFRDYVEGQLKAQAQDNYDNEVQSAVLEYLNENTTFTQDPPAEMVDRFTKSYTDMLTSYATQYGTDLATFMNSFSGSTEDTYEDDIRNMAMDTAKEYIELKAIADREDLNVSKKDYNTAASTRAASLGYSTVKEFEEAQGAEEFLEYLTVQKVLDFLKEKAVVTAPTTEE